MDATDNAVRMIEALEEEVCVAVPKQLVIRVKYLSWKYFEQDLHRFSHCFEAELM